jgi:trehalose transport system substrate-binding protein
MWREGLLARESLLGRFDTEVANLESGTSWLAENWAYTSASLASARRLDEFRVYPGWRGPRGRMHVVGGDVLGVPAGLTGAERRAALGLARFLMSKSSQEHLARLNAWPAIRDDAYAVDRRLCSRGRGRCAPWTRAAPTLHAPTFEAIRTALQEGWYRPVAPWWPTVENQMTAATRRILEGGEPVRQVLDEAHAAIAAAVRSMGAEDPGA